MEGNELLRQGKIDEAIAKVDKTEERGVQEVMSVFVQSRVEKQRARERERERHSCSKFFPSILLPFHATPPPLSTGPTAPRHI